MTLEFKDYAKDAKLNLGSVLRTDPASSLKENQIYAIALASSYATKNADLSAYILAQAEDKISAAEIEAAKAAATIMGMNNIYYRFVHLVGDAEYGNLPAKLRMNVIGNPGIEQLDFELYSLAVSAINGCGLCIESHTAHIAKAGLDKTTIQHSVRIAAVVNSVAQALHIN